MSQMKGIGSHLIGANSYPAELINIIGTNLMNIIYSVVAVGYLSTILSTVFPAMSLLMATSISAGLLICAAPFEMMNSFVQNKPANIRTKLPSFLQIAPVFYLLALLSSLAGSVQFFIRSYVLMQNFASTAVAGSVYGWVARVGQLGIDVVSSRAVLFGGGLGLATHFLLSFANWDKFLLASSVEVIPNYATLASVVWFAVAVAALSAFIPLASAFFNMATVAIYFKTRELLADKSAKSENEVKQHEKPWWLNAMAAVSCLMLPLGSGLYMMVDFFNSYKVVGSLGLLSTYTVLGCALFGLVSWCQTLSMWGYNTTRYLHEKLGGDEPVDTQYPVFASLYYFQYAGRRLLTVVRELSLAVLDVFNNIFSYAFVNELSTSLLGVSVSIYFLHFCTVAALVNRLVIQHFQTSPDQTKLVSDKLREPSGIFATVGAKVWPTKLDITKGKHENPESEPLAAAAAA